MNYWTANNTPQEDRQTFRTGLISALTYGDNVWNEGLCIQSEKSNKLYKNKILNIHPSLLPDFALISQLIIRCAKISFLCL